MSPEIRSYHAQFPPEVQQRLATVHAVIEAEVPRTTTTCIAWRMPTFKHGKYILHYAAFQQHIGIFPGSAAVAELAPALERLHIGFGKGSIRFPHHEDLPLDLLREIVQRRLAAMQLAAG